MDTEQQNKAYREKLNEYREETNRVNEISKRNQSGEVVTKEEIDWLCSQLKFRTSQVESSWYDHG